MHIGGRIRLARRQAGLTQAQLAARIGEAQATVSYAERQAWVRRSVLEKYAQALQRPLAFFLEESAAVTEEPGPREAAIERAFEVVKRDPDFHFGEADDPGLKPDTKKDIVRLYEQARRVYLLPEGFE
jgi:transcriptional regulator with XRE-family HTH domain